MKIPATPPTLADLFSKVKDPERLGEVLTKGISSSPQGKYRHWEKLKRLQPPDGLSSREWWTGIKFARFQIRREVPLLQDKDGKPFTYSLADPVLELLHEIDRDASGTITTRDQITNPQTRDRYIERSLIEEAITSSQLEGASTTREVAKDMIRSGRAPIDQSELMILNNYRAIRLIDELKDQPLSRELLFTIHETLIRDTLEKGAERNYLRAPSNQIAVVDERNGTIVHQPPPADHIPSRMAAMFDFANQTQTGAFLHPILKAIILHFWLAYDHPFIDGNGRAARALFYWSVLSQGFWMFEFLSISSIIRKAPTKYVRSFLYTETDENDLTYFILAQLRVIQRAINELYAYLDKKADEIQKTEQFLQSSATINHRQVDLLGHALRHPGMRYTIASHEKSQGVTYQTARTDLLDLADQNLLVMTKSGRAFVFTAPNDLPERLRALS